MKHMAAVSKNPVVASSTVDTSTKITFIENILEAFEPLLTAKEDSTATT